jgi:hypothetical protein
MTAAKRLGFGEAARSSKPSGTSPPNAEIETSSDIPASILFMAANWYAMALRTQLIVAASAGKMSVKGHNAFLESLATFAEISTISSDESHKKSSLLAAYAKQARIACIDAVNHGAIGLARKDAMGRTLKRLTDAVSLVCKRVRTNKDQNIRSMTTNQNSIINSTVNSELVTCGDPQIAPSAARTFISTAMKNLDEAKQAKAKECLRSSSELPCNQATHLLLPVLAEISCGGQAEEFRGNATYLMEWLAGEPAERTPPEKVRSQSRNSQNQVKGVADESR